MVSILRRGEHITMTKKEYFDVLKEALEFYPQEIQDYILSSFEEHFEEGLKQGQTEEEIMARLGDVEDILNYIDEKIASGELSTSKEKKDYSKELNQIEQGMSGLATIVKDIIKDTMVTVDTVLSKTPKINIEKVDDKTFTGNLSGEFHQLEVLIEGSPCDIRVTNTLGMCSYEYSTSVYTDDHNYLYTKIDHGKATIQIKQPKTGLEYSGDLVLFIPSSIEELTIHTKSGDINIEKLNVQKLSAETISGDILVDDLSAQQTHLNTSSGDIRIEMVEGNVSVQTVSGDIDVGKCFNGKTILRSTSGDIDVNNLDEVPLMIVETISGDIDCEVHTKNFAVEIETTAGDFNNKTSLTGFKDSEHWILGKGEGAMKIRSVSGDITLKETGQAAQ